MESPESKFIRSMSLFPSLKELLFQKTVFVTTLLVAILLVWTACVIRLNRGHTGNLIDDGMYLVSAQALRDGNGYTLPSRPGIPPASKYTIGFPGIMAIMLWLFSNPESLAQDVIVTRGLVIVSGWLFFIFTFFLLRRIEVGALAALLIVTVIAFHPTTIIYAITIMSDVPFCFITFVVMFYWVSQSPEQVSKASRDAAVVGLLVAIACLLRANGITLALGSLLWLVFRPQWKFTLPVFTVIGGCGTALGLFLNKSLSRGYPPANDYFSSLQSGYESIISITNIITNNLQLMVQGVSGIILPNISYTRPVAQTLNNLPIFYWILCAAILLLLLAGVAKLILASKLRHLPIWCHVILTLAIFILWPWSFDTRFIITLFPLIILAFGTGTDVLIQSIKNIQDKTGKFEIATYSLVLLGCLSVVGRVAWQASYNGGYWGDASQRKNFDSMLGYVKTHLEPNAIVATLTPEMIFLYTGRQAIPLISDGDWLRQRYGRREGLETWMRQSPDRPFYLLSTFPGLTQEVDSQQAAALVMDPLIVLREIYRSPDNAYWLASVSVKKSNDK